MLFPVVIALLPEWIRRGEPFLIPLALKIVHVLHVTHSASHRTAGPNDLIVKIPTPR